MEATMSLKRTLIVTTALAASWSAFGAGGGPMTPSSSPTVQTREPPSPEEQARTAYNAGLRGIAKADELTADAARQTDARKQQKLRDKAQGAYQAALKKFTRATELRPGMHEAWNHVGYSQRKLGRFDAALTAYDRALTLKPDYPQAIEYRGHAYLRLNRLGEAKESYLKLFAANRELAASLLTAMQQWVGEHRGDGAMDDGAYSAFAAWVSERSSIASQTAGLTREGAAAWN
jgi:tetratricopeptide (TPR) repeat protein